VAVRDAYVLVGIAALNFAENKIANVDVAHIL
jgi:hypothetical protein